MASTMVVLLSTLSGNCRASLMLVLGLTVQRMSSMYV